MSENSESDSQEYEPQCEFVYEEDEQKKPQHKEEKKMKEGLFGAWTEEQNVKYALFIDCHYAIFASKEKRKSTQIFKALSNFLKTRTPRQCRSHFQKIILKFKKIKKMKQFYQNLLGDSYKKKFQEVFLFLQENSVQRNNNKTLISVGMQTEIQKQEAEKTFQNNEISMFNFVQNLYYTQMMSWQRGFLPLFYPQ